MSYAEELMYRADDLFDKAKAANDMKAKKSYLINAYHIAMNAEECGEHDATILMRDIKKYADLKGIDID